MCHYKKLEQENIRTTLHKINLNLSGPIEFVLDKVKCNFIFVCLLIDEDIHQCGRCKEIFHDVTIYLKHKSSKMCKTGKGKSSAEQTPVKQQQLQQQQNTGTVADNQQSASIDNKQQSASSNNSSTISDEASETASSTNQNILEAAAKNTIFRDSFISMANQPADGLEKPASNDEGDNYNNEFWSKDKQQSDVIMPSEDLAETGKKSMLVFQESQ